MKKIFKFGCLTLLGLFALGLIVSIFIPEEERKEISRRSEERRQEAAEMENPETDFEMMAQKADYSVHALNLIKEYDDNEFAADEKYKGVIVLVRGKISNMHKTLGMHFLNLESVNFIMSVSCKMKKSTLPVLQQLSKDQDVLVVGEVTGSTAGLSVDMKNCLVMTVADYQRITQ